MRARHILLLLAIASCSVTGLLVACGGTADDTVTPDAGKDVTVDAPKDVTPDVVVDAGPPPCATDADLFTVAIPDGNIADSGVSVQVCGTCLKTSCKSDISDCNKVCDCKDAVIGLYDCLSKGKGLQACGLQNFLGASQETQNIGLSLVGCASSSCKDECGLGDGGFLTDSGLKDSGGGG
jgi:hypothetical protein